MESQINSANGGLLDLNHVHEHMQNLLSDLNGITLGKFLNTYLKDEDRLIASFTATSSEIKVVMKDGSTVTVPL